MSPRSLSRTAKSSRAVFAALGDETRLSIVTRLSSGLPCSISELTAGTRLTRQAVTKHLRVLGNAGVVNSVRTGRERRFTLDPAAFAEMRSYLAFVSEQWAQALSRLKSFVEK